MVTRRQSQSVVKDGEKIFYHCNEILKLYDKKLEKVDKLDTFDKSVLKLVDSIKKLTLKNKSSLGKEVSMMAPRGGLTKLIPISDELRVFLGVDDPSQKFSRTDVTRAICAYIAINPNKKKKSEDERWYYLNDGSRNLQDPSDKTKIIPDDKLSKLLRYEEYVDRVKSGLETMKKRENGVKVPKTITDPSLRYFIVQRLLKPHFLDEPKATQVEAPRVTYKPRVKKPPNDTSSPRRSYKSINDSLSNLQDLSL